MYGHDVWYTLWYMRTRIAFIGFGVMVVVFLVLLSTTSPRLKEQTLTNNPSSSQDSDQQNNKKEVSALQYPMNQGQHRIPIEAGDVNRDIVLDLVTDIDENETYPLVVALHAYRFGPGAFYNDTDVATIGRSMDAIMVYPQGVSESWNAGICCGQAYQRDIDDVSFITGVISRMIQEYPIDPSRVYLVGYSNGAMLSYYVASEIPDEIAAIGVVAGSVGGRAQVNGEIVVPSSFDTPVPAIIVHGTDDTIVTFGAQQSMLDGLFFTPTFESAEWWAGQNGCDTSTPQPTTQGAVNEYAYDCPDNASVLLYTLTDIGHIWPTTVDGLSEVTEAETIAELIGTFFAGHVANRDK